jgi:hypothetical protein
MELQYKVEGYRYIPSIIRIYFILYSCLKADEDRGGAGGGRTQR